MSVIGIQLSPKDRKSFWNSLIFLQEVLKSDTFPSYEKEKKVYNYLLASYVRPDESNS